MRTKFSTLQRFGGTLVSVASLLIILLFTYARFFEVPYSGFHFSSSTGKVDEIYLPVDSVPLQIGDVIKNIGGISWEDYQSDGTVIFFENAQVGDVVEIIVSRNGAEKIIPWNFPGFNSAEFNARFFNLWWLAYFFWIFGLLTQVLIRPRDLRWRLMSLAYYLTGLWVIFGTVSASSVWGSSLLLHAVTWLLVPVYLHLHWIFPRPLRNLPRWVWYALYLVGFIFAVGELTQALPRSVYFLGFLLMLLGMIALLIVHAVRQPDQRREVALVGVAVLAAILPVISLGTAGLANHIPQIGPLALAALPIIPSVYFYIVYQQRLGGLELRANRFLSIYAFLILLGTVLLLLLAPAALSSISTGTLIILSMVTALLAAYVSIAVFPAFRSLVDQRLLGIRLPYQNLLEAYSSRITTSSSMPELLRLLENEVFPSLLVRQFAFLQLSGVTRDTLLAKGIEENQLPGREEAISLTALAGRFLPPGDNPAHPWIRLILSLKLGETVIGLWLLGRRDPDDAYHEVEIPILQSLADQTAIAMSNLLQTERLRTLYQLDIDRREQERLRLALELHDSVLKPLAVLRMNVDESNLSPNFQQAYEEVVQRLREIVSDLRPPMLNYGLKLALEELAQDWMEPGGNRARVTLAMWGEEERYPQNIEQHLFRIVQEACENALHHSKAANVLVSAQLDAERVTLEIQDDGIGFEMGERLELDDLLVRKHFGLAGIVERANLIGAQARIWSEPKTGTRIRIIWNRTPPQGPE